jgi:hypothetical protein
MALADRRMRRFRPHFSLRTLLVVVTVVCCFLGWLGWNWRIVQERKQIIEKIEANEGFTVQDNVLTAIPTIREWIGDKPYQTIVLPQNVYSPKEIENIRTHFAETNVLVVEGLTDESFTEKDSSTLDWPATP